MIGFMLKKSLSKNSFFPSSNYRKLNVRSPPSHKCATSAVAFSTSPRLLIKISITASTLLISLWLFSLDTTASKGFKTSVKYSYRVENTGNCGLIPCKYDSRRFSIIDRRFNSSSENYYVPA